MQQPWSRVSEGFERADLFQTQQAYGLQVELKSLGIYLFELHLNFWMLHISLISLYNLGFFFNSLVLPEVWNPFKCLSSSRQ